MSLNAVLLHIETTFSRMTAWNNYFKKLAMKSINALFLEKVAANSDIQNFAVYCVIGSQVNGMNKNRLNFEYLWQKCSRLSEAKTNENSFRGLQIKDLFKNEEFNNTLLEHEELAWNKARLVVTNILWSKKANDYFELIEKIFQSNETIVCNMSLKIYLLHSHLDIFSKNNVAVSDEQGEHFHQNNAAIEKKSTARSGYFLLTNYG